VPPRAAVPAPAPPLVEEAAPWEHLAGDTDDARARLDTDHARGSSRARINQAREAAQARRRLIVILSIVGGVAVVLSGLVLWLALRGESGGKGKPSDGERQRAVLTVGPDADFKTIADALTHARSGDRIVVQGDTVREPAQRFPPPELRDLTNITIEAADPKKKVTWKLPPGQHGVSWLVTFEETDGWRLRGFKFDGGDQVDTIGFLSRCRGITLEDIELTGFRKSGLHFINCAAPERAPILLSRVSVNSALPPLVFEVSMKYDRPRMNSNIIVEKDCSFTGGGKVQKKDLNGRGNEGVELPPNVTVEKK